MCYTTLVCSYNDRWWVGIVTVSPGHSYSHGSKHDNQLKLSDKKDQLNDAIILAYIEHVYTYHLRRRHGGKKLIVLVNQLMLNISYIYTFLV